MNTVLCIKHEGVNYFTAHSHKYWEVSLHLSGSSNIVLDGVSYNMKENNIRLIPPGTSHIGLKGDNFSDIYFHAKNLDFKDITVVYDYDGSVRCLFELLHDVMLAKEENYASIADSLTDTICQYIKKYAKTDYKYDFIAKFKHTIHENISNSKFNISDEIRDLGFNTDYFRRCFKEELGQTPLEYMTNLRINTAKKMLTQKTFQSIENTAYNCGFNDSFYFSKIFKKITGISPRDYQKNHNS